MTEGEHELTPDEEQRLDEIVALYVESIESGEQPDRDALVAANPRLGPALRAFFRDMESLGRVTRDLPSPARGLRPHETIGGYEILEEIARGGMGVVYRARQSGLGRVVALKVVLSGRLASDAEIERFRREATAAAALDHPNIVPIHDVGESEGVHYFTMKYIEGRSLAHAMPVYQSRMTDAADLLRTIADAVHHAHESGVLHRDLKPANILLAEDGRPFVTDFGLARHLDNDSNLTRTGDIVGTPTYMSPEQAAGENESIDERTDVYSLGAILYEMISGRPPFRASTPLETLRLVREGEPTAPRRWRAGIPRDLETICLKCLEKEPRRRYASAGLLADELRRFRAGETIFARRVSSPERAWRWCRRNPAVAILLTAIVSLLAMIAVGASLTSVGLRNALWRSYRDQARALRSSNHPQRRLLALEALKNAVGIRRDATLRDDAIACLALTSLGAEEIWTPPSNVESGDNASFRIAIDSRFERIAWSDATGAVRVFDRSKPPSVKDAVIFASAAAGIPASRLRFGPRSRFVAAQYGSQNPVFLHVLDTSTGERAVDTMIIASCFDFHPDEPQIAVTGRDGAVTLVGLASGKEERRVLAASVQAGALRFSSDGTRLAIAVRPTEIRVVDLDSGSTRIIETPDPVASLAWDPRGTTLAAGCFGCTIQLLDVEGRRSPVTLHGHEGSVMEVTMRGDGTLLASGSWDGSLRLWTPDTATELLRIDGGGDPFFRNDGKQVATVLGSSRLRICDVLGGDAFRVFSGVDHFDIGPDGRVLARADPAGGALIDLEGHREIQTTQYPLLRCHFAPRGGFMISWYRKAGVFLSRTERRRTESEEILAIGPHTLLMNSTMLLPRRMAISDNGDLVAISLTDRNGAALSRVAIVSTGDPMAVESTVVHGGADAVALSPRGRWLATGTWHGEDLKIWNARSGEIVHTIHTSGTTRNATSEFSRDGNWLLTSTGGEYAVRRTGEWDLPLWTVERDDPNSIPGAIAISADSRMVAICPNRRTLELRETESGRKLAALTGTSSGLLRRIRFSSDGERLWAARGEPASDRGNPGTLEVWNLRRLRAELAGLGLDWDGPPIDAPRPPEAILPLRVELDVVSLTMIALNPIPVVKPE